MIPVNTEGLTTVDEKMLVRNESLLNQKSSPSSGDGWQNYGKEEREIPLLTAGSRTTKGKERRGEQKEGKGARARRRKLLRIKSGPSFMSMH